MTVDDPITVTRNDATSRYEIHADGQVAGFLLFKPLEDGRVLLPHTVVHPEFGGRGLGSRLAADALADLARRGDVVVPTCPFVTRYLGEHEVPGLRIEWPDREDGPDGAVA